MISSGMKGIRASASTCAKPHKISYFSPQLHLQSVDILLPTQCGPVLSHDDLHRSDDLLGHRGRHGGGVQGAVGVATEVVDQLLKDKK